MKKETREALVKSPAVKVANGYLYIQEKSYADDALVTLDLTDDIEEVAEVLAWLKERDYKKSYSGKFERPEPAFIKVVGALKWDQEHVVFSRKQMGIQLRGGKMLNMEVESSPAAIEHLMELEGFTLNEFDQWERE